MINIDSFKNINDNYGHEIGDKIIVNLSEILRANTGQNDIIARFNGGEFCILLKNISSEDALDILNKIGRAHV